jgi:hypothetical protein
VVEVLMVVQHLHRSWLQRVLPGGEIHSVGFEGGSDQHVTQVSVSLEGSQGGFSEEGLELVVFLEDFEVVEESLFNWEVVGMVCEGEEIS